MLSDSLVSWLFNKDLAENCYY